MPQGPLATKIYSQNTSKSTVPVLADSGYVACPGNATTKLGGNGTIGDILQTLVISPAAANAGNVSITDGNVTIPVYVLNGNLSNGTPFDVTFGPGGIASANGAWSVVTPVSVTVLAIGQFTA